MGIWILLVLFAAGFFVAWYLRLLSRKIENLSHQEKNLPDAFKAISFDLANSNRETFLSNAKTLLDGFIAPQKETYQRLEQVVLTLEKKVAADYVGLQKGIEQTNFISHDLKRETANLVNALRRPDVRGRWGELTLRRAVELAGMVQHCDFQEQVVFKENEAQLRPDMIVNLPNNRVIVVDSKAPLDAYVEATGKTAEEERKESFRRYARHVKEHLAKLSKKNYWEEIEKTIKKSPDFVVMFIPGEAFLSAALSEEQTLLEEAFDKKVILASPSTLIALLRTIAYGWKEVELAQNAREIWKFGKELSERLGIWMDHFSEIGKSLEKAVKSYNQAIGSFETRVAVTARRFQELGAYEDGKMELLQPVEEAIRRDTSHK